MSTPLEKNSKISLDLQSRLFNAHTRVGAYGLVNKNDQILLIDKSSGPYQNEYDLPGGKIEHGESPYEALVREFLEEVCLQVKEAKLIDVYSHAGLYRSNEGSVKYHQIAIVYLILSYEEIENLIPEEKFLWKRVEDINVDHLTPGAKKAIQFYINSLSK